MKRTIIFFVVSLTCATALAQSSSPNASGLKTTGAPVNVSASAPPAGAGYICKTTDATHCTWQLTGSGSGDVVGPSSSVNGQLAIFSGTSGKLLAAFASTGILKATSGVVSAAVADTDYEAPHTTLAGYGITDGVSTSRTISTTSPLGGGGALSSNLTFTCTLCLTTSSTFAGDIGGTSGATVLATVNAGPGTYGDASHVGQTVVNGKGLVTSGSSVAISISPSAAGLGSVTNDTQTKVAILPNTAPSSGQLPIGNAGGTAYTPQAVSGDGSLASTGVFTFATVNSSPGTTGDASHVGQFTTDGKGRVTAQSSLAIAIAEAAVTGLVSDLAAKQASGNYVTALTGDVTASGPGSVAATIAQGAVTDDKASLLNKPAGAVVATSTLTLSGLSAVDGVTPIDGTIILASAQTTGSQNGPWVAHSGAWTRPSWYPSGGTTQAGQFSTMLIRLGTESGHTWRMTTAAPITIDTTATTWVVTPYNMTAAALSGALPAAQEPAHTGDTTNTAGSLALTTKQAHWTPKAITVSDSPYTVASADTAITCDASGGAVTINLPATTGGGRAITIKKTDSSSNGCTPTRAGSDTIDGAASYSLTTQYAASAVWDLTSGVWSRMHVNQLGGDLSGVSTNVTVAKVNGNTPGVAAVAHQFVTAIDSSARGTLAQPADADLSFTDITTNNATTSLHGFLPKLGGGTTNFLRADGSWAAPSAGANTALSNLASVAINADLTTGAGTAANFTATAPAAAASTTSGATATVTASAATAGTTNAGAAAGGSVTITSGAAARLTSGNANGGDINLNSGAGIGTGVKGNVVVGTAQSKLILPMTGIASGDGCSLCFTSDTTSGLGRNTSVGGMNIYGVGTAVAVVSANSMLFDSTKVLGWTSSSVNQTADTGLSRVAAGVTGGGTGGAGSVAGTARFTYYETVVGGNVTSASTITPTGGIFHVTGTTQITTISLPRTGFTGCLRIIPDGAGSTAAGGNIALGTTFVVNKLLEECYDGTSWYPSY